MTKGIRYRDYGTPIKVAEELYDVYDWASFSIADGVSDYDVNSQQANLFKHVPTARGIIIWSDQDISIKFNSTSYAAITHEAVYAPHEWFNKFKIINIYIANASGSTANIKVFLV